MLDGVHAEPGEGLYVNVPVVQRVHVFIHEPDMDEAVRKVEVESAPQGNDGQPCSEAKQVARGGKDVCICYVG